MENLNYTITGNDTEITATKNFETGDCHEIILSLTFQEQRDDIDVEFDVVSSTFYGFDSEHPVTLSDEQRTELETLVYRYVNDNAELFDYEN